MWEENIVGEVHAPEKDYDLTTVVMVCLGDPEEKNYGGLLKMLDVLLSNTMECAEKKEILQEEFAIPMTEEMEREVRTMSNLGQGIAEENLKKGRTEGRSETWMDAIRGLMETLNFSIDQAMSALKVPESDRPKYRELLSKQ